MTEALRFSPKKANSPFRVGGVEILSPYSAIEDNLNDRGVKICASGIFDGYAKNPRVDKAAVGPSSNAPWQNSIPDTTKLRFAALRRAMMEN